MATQTATKEWNDVPFSDCLLKVKVGREKQVKEKDYSSSGLYPIVDQGQSFVAGYTNDEKKVISGIQPFIIFGDHTRALKYIDFPVVLGADGTKVIKPNTDFDTKFFYYSLKHIDVPSRGYNRHYTLLKEKSIARPSLPEQKAIAQTLTTVQNAIAEQEKLIAKLKELKRSMMQHLFTHGTKDEKTKMTEIGEMPDSWQVVRLGDVCDVSASSITFKQAQVKTGDVVVLGVKVSDMNILGNEKYLKNAVTTFHFSDTKRLIPPGAIIFPKRGAAIATNKKRLSVSYSLLDPNLIAIVPKQDLLSDFIFYFFEMFNLSTLTEPGTIPQLNKKDLAPVLLPQPSAGEQRKIVASISAVEKLLETSSEKMASYQNLFKTLLHELMSRERRINI